MKNVVEKREKKKNWKKLHWKEKRRKEEEEEEERQKHVYQSHLLFCLDKISRWHYKQSIRAALYKQCAMLLVVVVVCRMCVYVCVCRLWIKIKLFIAIIKQFESECDAISIFVSWKQIFFISN